MDIDEIRRNNIKALESMHGAALYKSAGMSPTQFYNLRDGAKDSKTGKPRGMRKETAWRLEDAAGVPRGYLDKPHDFEIKPTAPQLAQQAQTSHKVTDWPFTSVTPSEWRSIPVHKRQVLEEQIKAMVPSESSRANAA